MMLESMLCDQRERDQRRRLRHVMRLVDVRFANTQALCNSFKMELLNGSHAFGTQAANGTRTVTTKDVFRLALYLVSATINGTTTAYSSTGELAGTGGYTQTGKVVTNATVPAKDTGTISSGTAYWTPSDVVQWTSFTSSGAFDAALLYNDSSTGKLSVAVFTFGSQTITGGTFTLTMPNNNETTGLIRITSS